MSGIGRIIFLVRFPGDILTMPNPTLKQLRAQAKSLGLRGYSKLSRAELEKLLARQAGAKPAAAAKPKTAAARAKPVRGRGGMSAQAQQAPTTATPAAAPKWEWAADISRQPADEQRIESAKYAMVPPGAAEPRAEAADLNENIDNLPPVTEPTLCLLPQKPGVLHGYWIVPAQALPHPRPLKLRLGRISGDVFTILDEVALSQERGHWYFHVDESADAGAVYLQLGYYEPDGRFVTAIRRGIARIPSLHASGRTDRLWWVSEEQFRAMYRRAGGIVRGPRLGWAASIGSPGGAPSSERNAWPGGASSQR